MCLLPIIQHQVDLLEVLVTSVQRYFAHANGGSTDTTMVAFHALILHY